MMPVSVPGARAGLMIAHPGHELLVHGWLEVAHPRVFVLTDGSGRCAQSRLGINDAAPCSSWRETGFDLRTPAGPSAVRKHP